MGTQAFVVRWWIIVMLFFLCIELQIRARLGERQKESVESLSLSSLILPCQYI